MGTAILALLVALAPALVEILKAFLEAQTRERNTNEALIQVGLTELHAATDDKLRDTPVQP